MNRCPSYGILRHKRLARVESRFSTSSLARRKIRIISQNQSRVVVSCASYSSGRSGSYRKRNKKGKGENAEVPPESTTTTAAPPPSSSAAPTAPSSSEPPLGAPDGKKDKNTINKDTPVKIPNEHDNVKQSTNDVDNGHNDHKKWRRKNSVRQQPQQNVAHTIHTIHRHLFTPFIESRRRYFVETLCDILMKKLTTEPEKIAVSFNSFPYYLSDALKESLIHSCYIQMTQFPQWRMSPSYTRTLKTFINLTGPKGTEIYQEQLVRALAKHYGAKFVDLDIERLDLMDLNKEVDFMEQDEVNAADIIQRVSSIIKRDDDYEGDDNSFSEQPEHFYRPLLMALEMMLERDQKRYSQSVTPPKYIIFIRGVHPLVFRSIVPELKSARFLYTTRSPILFVLSTAKDPKVKREPTESFATFLPISILKRSKNGAVFEEKEIPIPPEHIQRRLEVLKELIPHPIEVYPPKDDPQLIIRWNTQIEQDRKNYLILRNLSRLYALLDKKRITLDGELPKFQEFSERRYTHKELEQIISWALNYHSQRTQSSAPPYETAEVKSPDETDVVNAYIDIDKVSKKKENETETENLMRKSKFEDKNFSRLYQFFELFDEETIKKQIDAVEKQLARQGEDSSNSPLLRLLRRAFADFVKFRQRNSPAQKNTNTANEDEVENEIQSQNRNQNQTTDQTETANKSVTENDEDNNMTKSEDVPLSNALVNLGTIPRSLVKKFSKSLSELSVWQNSEFFNSFPFGFFPKVQIQPEDIAYAVNLMTKLHQLDPTLHKAKTLDLNHYEQVLLSAVVYPQDIDVTFDDIGALPKVKEYLQELAILPLLHPQLFSRGNLKRSVTGVLLFGPPGTGKTMLAKAVAKESSATFINISMSQITSKWYGDAEKYTAAIFSLAKKLAPSIIFVDEVDSFLSTRGGGTEHEASRRMKNEFMAHWDGLKSTSTLNAGNPNSTRVLVMAATNRPFDLDDAVLRRLNRRILVDMPDKEARVQILQKLLRDESLMPDFDINRLAAMTEGYTGSDLKNLCIAAAYEVVRKFLAQKKLSGNTKINSEESLPPISMADFVAALEEVKPSVNDKSTSVAELRKWNEMYGEGKHKSVELGF